MKFDTSYLPDPQNRTAAQWVEYYLHIENAVALGQSVEVEGQKITHHNLDTIVNLRKGWESRASQTAGKLSGASAYAPTYLG